MTKTEPIDWIQFVNISRSVTGVGRFARDIFEVVKNSAEFFSFMLDKRYPSSDYPGTAVAGFFPMFSTGWYINTKFFNIVFRKSIKKIRNQEKDGIYTHYTGVGMPPLSSPELGIISIHDLFFLNEKLREDYPHRRYLARNFSGFLKFSNCMVPSSWVKEEILNAGFKGNVTVIHHSVDSHFRPLNHKDELRTTLKLPLGKILVLSVSSAEKRKNLGVVKKTIDELGGNYQLVRVGPEVPGSVTFKGVDVEKLNMIYNACDVLLLPSIAEGFGYPLIEAFSAGLPAVVSDIDVMREIGGDSAIFVENDAKHSAIGVKEALTRREELSAKGVARSTEFSFGNFSKRVEEYYRNLQ